MALDVSSGGPVPRVQPIFPESDSQVNIPDPDATQLSGTLEQTAPTVLVGHRRVSEVGDLTKTGLSRTSKLSILLKLNRL